MYKELKTNALKEWCFTIVCAPKNDIYNMINLCITDLYNNYDSKYYEDRDTYKIILKISPEACDMVMRTASFNSWYGQFNLNRFYTNIEILKYYFGVEKVEFKRFLNKDEELPVIDIYDTITDEHLIRCYLHGTGVGVYINE